MKDTLLSSQASHATRGTVSRQPLGAPDQAYQTETRMSNPDPSPGQSHDHPDRQTASRRLDQAYQIRSPKSTPAHITSHHTKQPRNQSRPSDAASHPQAAHLTLPINNPQVKPGPKRLHTADTPYPWPTQRRKAKPHPHKTTQKPGQPRKDSVYITHLSRKNKIGLARVEIGRGHAARAWWHGAITCGADGSMTRVIAVVFDTPHHVWGSCRRVNPEMVESGGPHLL